MTAIMPLSPEYRDWLVDLKQRIRSNQLKAALSVNSQLIMLYWDLGRQITEKQETAQWGTGFIDQLSKDLRAEFPEMAGFSRTNLFTMKKFYQFYSPLLRHIEIVPQAAGQLEDSVPKLVHQAVGQLENDDQQIVPQLVGQFQNIIGQEVAIWKQLVSKLVSILWCHNVCIIEN